VPREVGLQYQSIVPGSDNDAVVALFHGRFLAGLLNNHCSSTSKGECSLLVECFGKAFNWAN